MDFKKRMKDLVETLYAPGLCSAVANIILNLATYALLALLAFVLV